MSSGPPNKRLRQTVQTKINFAVSGRQQQLAVSGQGQVEVSIQQDDLLDFPACYRINRTPTDGNCMFAAIADQLGLGMDSSGQVRHDLVNYVETHSSDMVSRFFLTVQQICNTHSSSIVTLLYDRLTFHVVTSCNHLIVFRY